MSYHFRHAICNEIYQGWDFAKSCAHIKATGYEAIEIAPFTLSDDPASIPAAQRAEYRRIIGDAGLQFAGLHWLMVAPKGLHVTTPDAALRARGWALIRDLVDLCADLGPNGVMVFGSPKQRETTGGATRDEATRRYIDGLAAVAPHAAERGVTILVEALPSDQCDVVLSLEEAVSIVNEINSPGVRTMFDTHNAVNETEPHAVLVDRYFEYIRHVHVNETDGGHCGTGDYDFGAVLRVLRDRNYQGWVSLEAFNFDPGPDRIASESLRHLEKVISTL
ncbi:MAG: sugar phosphate isomerase/epimerase [Bryobacteraceae bacterium]|nr:sugar phosphate isomerase/epimerase [Solibacteraceae bacterium]MCL4842945.1 sugar phosphate isomerase/epimerase [Bryobacteraceae bacterium]MCO5351587.1 sugar phosphate isomerase/epimerase [Bryobacteraceae bacterium]